MVEDRTVDLERMLDLATPWCLRVAATLRIPEHITAGRTGIAELAAAVGCDRDALHIAAEFDALMGPAGHGVPDFDIELSHGWEGIRTVVDVGGGTGAMLASLLRRHPRAQGILVDFPGTVARAGEVIESFGVAGRVTVCGQSFFDPLPAGADLYLLKSVLNGGVSPDESPRSLGIDMLVAGGKTSTLSQFAELARQAGLEVAAARTQASGRFVVECKVGREAQRH